MVERAKILLQSLAAASFRNDDDIITGEQPGKGSLRRSHAVFPREIDELPIESELGLLNR